MSDNESEPTLYESYFDDSDYEFKNFNEMNLIQLVIYKKQLKQLTEGNTLTNQQELMKTKLKVDIWNEYPATLTNATEKEADHDKKMKNLEIKKYKAECFKINKIKFENSKDIIEQIEVFEKELRIKSETKYKTEHKEYMNAKCICECGMETIRKNKSTHKKSKVHQNYEAKLEKIKLENELKLEKINKQKQINSRMNNGYKLDNDRKVIWPLDQNGNRIYLTDEHGKNIYPKNPDGTDIWMKDSCGFSIRPDQEKSSRSWFQK